MQAIIERCCGLDVHQETVVACLLIGAAGARAHKEVRTFRTMRRELEALRDWLTAAGGTHVGMGRTGVYWRPVYAVLEGHVELIVGNARHIRNVPGRKTDVKDAEWIADLVRHGLIAKSFVPPPPLRELRELLRYRRKLIEAQAAERNRLLRLLETANIKLASVMSDVFGVWPGYAESAYRRQRLSRGDRGPRQRPTAPQAHRADRSSHRRRRRASPFPARDAARPHRGDRSRCCRPRRADRRKIAALWRRDGLVDDHSWGQLAGRRGYYRRNRHRHERLPQRPPPCRLGRRLPRQL